MRRHESLRTLSRDHHHALQLARGLQRGVSPGLRAALPADTDALIAEVQRRFAEELDVHFLLEEEVLAPAIQVRDAGLAVLATELHAQHRALRRAVAALSTAAEPDAALDTVGRLLEQHVRWEERVLFEEIQQRLDARVLRDLSFAGV